MPVASRLLAQDPRSYMTPVFLPFLVLRFVGMTRAL